jgi:hypothetical protein
MCDGIVLYECSRWLKKFFFGCRSQIQDGHHHSFKIGPYGKNILLLFSLKLLRIIWNLLPFMRFQVL